MLKVLIIVSLFASTCLTLNPGVYGFVSKRVIENIKNSVWPKVHEQLANIVVPGSQKVNVKIGKLFIQRLIIHIDLKAEQIQIDLEQDKNQIRVHAENVQLSGIAHWVVKTLWSNSGNVTVHGIVGSLVAYMKLDNQPYKDGFVPKLVFGDVVMDITSLSIHTTSSILSPVINLITDNMKGNIRKEINKQVSNNGDIRGQLEKELNGLIRQNYPIAIPIKELDVYISAYVTNQIDIYDSGFQVPLEGFVYNKSSGYKQIGTCPGFNNYVDPKNLTNDMYAALGDCTVRSLIDALAESGFQYNMKLSNSVVKVDLMLSLAKWDNYTVEFTKDNLKLGIGIVAKGTIEKDTVEVTANAQANVSITRRNGLRKICHNKPNFKFLNIAKKYQISGGCTTDNQDNSPDIVENESIASYDVLIRFEKVDNIVAIGMPDFQISIFKKLLLQNNLDANFDVPQFCIADEMCFTHLDAAINENFISSDANVDFKSAGINNLGKVNIGSEK